MRKACLRNRETLQSPSLRAWHDARIRAAWQATRRCVLLGERVMSANFHMRRLRLPLRIVLYLAVSAFLFGICDASVRASQGGKVIRLVRNPDAAPEFKLDALDGKPLSLATARGKVVLLNFWATWCGPCTDEMPRLVSAEKEYRSRGIVFIAASLDNRKSRRKVPEFVTTYQIGFPVWIGATGEDLAKLGMGDAVPSTAFIDRDGRIVARVEGSIRPEELRERIEWLLGDRTVPGPQPLIRHFGRN
jgi:thiol-disulfide isomerase/thioredoxin